MSGPEEITATDADCFEQAATWYARWRDAAEGKAPEPF